MDVTYSSVHSRTYQPYFTHPGSGSSWLRLGSRSKDPSAHSGGCGEPCSRSPILSRVARDGESVSLSDCVWVVPRQSCSARNHKIRFPSRSFHSPIRVSPLLFVPATNTNTILRLPRIIACYN